MQDINPFRFGTMWTDGDFRGEIAFRNMRVEFERVMAQYRGEVCEGFYLFGGQRVRIRIVGRELAEHFLRPFSHLQIGKDGFPSLRLSIDLWDVKKVSLDSQRQPLPADAGWTEKTVQSTDGRFVGQQLPNTASCLDREQNHIMAAISWHNQIFIYERAKPLARLLLNWHNDQDLQMIHAALVARANHGILFIGKSGSGKSTTSLACIDAGLGFLSEDYVSLELSEDGGFIGHSLYNSVFLKTDQLERFPALAPYAIRGRLPHEEKSVIVLSQVYPERLKRAVPIRALVLPRVVDAPNLRILPVAKGQTLLALGPSSLLQIPNRGLGVRGFNKLAQLVQAVPSFRLEVGPDLSAIPRRLEDLFAEISST
jgi:hypothetical protein